MEYQTGEKVLLKKPHPCGSRDFIITRTGADFKLKCCGCGHVIMLDIADFKKRLKKVYKNEQ